eukprot:SAG22_NODE_2103_length_3009_cov_6.486254_4_plen_69_part_00
MYPPGFLNGYTESTETTPRRQEVLPLVIVNGEAVSDSDLDQDPIEVGRYGELPPLSDEDLKAFEQGRE